MALYVIKCYYSMHMLNNDLHNYQYNTGYILFWNPHAQPFNSLHRPIILAESK